METLIEICGLDRSEFQTSLCEIGFCPRHCENYIILYVEEWRVNSF